MAKKSFLSLFALAAFASANTIWAGTCTVTVSTTNQYIHCIGASSAWSSVSSFGSALFADDTVNGHLGLTSLRTRIDPTDTGSGSAWNSELNNINSAVAANPNVLFWSTEWSPPATYKSNNSVDGYVVNGSTTVNGGFTGSNGGSPNSSDTGYAAYLTRYIQYVKSYTGQNLYSISPQNEANFEPSYEGCTWTTGNFTSFVPCLAASITSAGLSTKIMIPEPDNEYGMNLASGVMDNASSAAMVGILCTHLYGENPLPLSNFGFTNVTNQEWWETEISGGNNLPISSDMTGGMAVAGWAHTSLVEGGMNSFHYWWLADLIVSNAFTSKAYVLGNYAKFIRPGYYRMGATEVPSSGVSVSAYKNTNTSSPQTIVIVAINSNTSAVNQTFSISGANVASVTPWLTDIGNGLIQQPAVSVSGGSFTYSMPVSSVVSFVGVVSGSVAPTNTPTPVSPTATATHTNTPVPPTATNTFTATHTNTPVPPTATFTWTATTTFTHTNTPVPPTATFTFTAVPPTNTPTVAPPTETFTAVPPTATRTFTALPSTATNTPVPSTPTFTLTPAPPTATNTAAPPTNTFTPAPPTATFTSTLTPVPPTATRTFTPVPPTATFTLTPVPPTATDTPTVVVSGGSFEVQLLSAVTSANTNSPHPQLQIVNTGSSPLNLNNVTVRYWFNCDCTTQSLQAWVDWAGLIPQGTNETGNVQVSVQPTSLGGQTDYVLYSFTGNIVLAPGGILQIQSRFNKSDWSNMNQDNDWSFAPYTSFTNAPDVTGYLDGALVWGQQPTSSTAALAVSSAIAFPNPSTGNGTTLSFTLGGNSTRTGASTLGSEGMTDPNAKVTLGIYTLAGRLIWSQTLTGGAYGSTGQHDVYWNEKDLKGFGLANGVYLLKVTVVSNGQTSSTITKILILG